MLNIESTDFLKIIDWKNLKVNQSYMLRFMNFSNNSMTNAAYHLYAMSKVMPIDNKLYENCLQFFILTCNDILKSQGIEGNSYAFLFAIKNLLDNVDYNEDLEKKFTEKEIINFFSRIKVLSPYVKSSKTIEWKPEIKEDVEKKKSDVQDAMKIVTAHGFKIVEKIPVGIGSFYRQNFNLEIEDKVEILLNRKSLENYYQLTLSNDNPTVETLELIEFVMQDNRWSGISKHKESIVEKLIQIKYFLEKDPIEKNSYLSIHVKDLFKKHLPQLLSYMEILRNTKIKDFNEQIHMIEEYCDKIIDSYIQETNFKMEVYKRFLKNKLSNI